MQLAQSIIRRSGISPSSSAIAIRVAVALYGAGAIDTSRALTTYGELVGARIVVREGLPPRRMHYTVARLVARLELHRLGAWTDAREHRTAAEIVIPQTRFEAELARDGLDLDALASRFAAPETCVALRAAELGIADAIVVSPSRVYRTGSPLGWLTDDDARALAEARAVRTIRRATIRDEPEPRVALLRSA